MSLWTKFLLAVAGLAICLAGDFFGSSGHVFWPTVVGGLLISPLWASLTGFSWGEFAEPRRSLFDDYRSCDVNHTSNDGPNLAKWSDS